MLTPQAEAVAEERGARRLRQDFLGAANAAFRLSRSALISGHHVCIFTHITSAEIIRRITAAGWRHVRTTGSHRHFRHSGQPGIVTVPHPKKDLPVGTLKSIERQSGVKLT